MAHRRRNRRNRRPRFLIPGILGAIGLSFVVLSAVPIQGSGPSGVTNFQGSGGSAESALMEVNDIRPLQAEPNSQGLPPLPESEVERPPRREPVPSDAMPVTSARAITGSQPRAGSPVVSRDTAPIRVGVVSNLDDPVLQSQALAVLSGNDRLQVYATELATLDRPDILLILDESQSGASAWFCGPQPNEASALAKSLLPFLSELGKEPDEAIGDAVDQSLPCSTLHAGRARMAAVYVRLPVSEVATEDLARRITEGITAYLDIGESRIRQRRSSHEVVWPAYGPITSHYGPDHTLGIDIGQSAGDIVSATDGTVTFAGGDACCSYGLYVTVESDDGITTLYGHLERLDVHEGDHVRAGDRLGPVGTTGHSSGYHLHFETLMHGERVNPLTLLP